MQIDDRGFKYHSDASGITLELVMPRELQGEISASFFGRGALMDEAQGDPTVIARRLSSDGSIFVAPIQVHGTATAEGRPIWALPQRPKADIVHLDPSYSGGAQTGAILRFADCSPILAASHVPHPWLVIAHSGFAGTTRGVMTEIASRIARVYPSCDMSDVHIWLGPAIGRCCYTRKLDDPSTQAAIATWHDANFEREGDEVRFDIHAEIRSQALDAGASEGNIYTSSSCTSCCCDEFYSYRRGETSARNALVARLR